jgi:hypothetical protein
MSGFSILKFVFLSFASVGVLATIFFGAFDFAQNITAKATERPGTLQASLAGSTANNTEPQGPQITQDMLPLRNWQVETLTLNATAAISAEISESSSKCYLKRTVRKNFPLRV